MSVAGTAGVRIVRLPLLALVYAASLNLSARDSLAVIASPVALNNISSASATPTPGCGNVCDFSFCGALPCGVRRFFGTFFGDALCMGPTDTGCECQVFECDSCGNGFVDASKDCDFGGTCFAGPNAGMPCFVFSDLCFGYCEPRGGNGCAANCTLEIAVSANFASVPYQVTTIPRPVTVSLAGPITFTVGKPGPPPPPPCRPVAVRRFAPSPVPSSLGCVCVQGVVNALAYGPGNVGIGVIGCADAPNTLRTDLTLVTWILPSGCDPGQPDDGSDGMPCTDDDPARQTASPVQTQFACAGDCNGDGVVDVHDLVSGINIALGNQPLVQCPSFDRNGDFIVTVNEVVAAVTNALDGCQGLMILAPEMDKMPSVAPYQ
jgi:hypothetical protein